MSKNWWKTFFEKDYARLFLRRDPRELAKTVRFLSRHLHVKEGDVLFDQCSGIGNVSHALAGRGYRTIGVDQSAPYVRQAQETAKREGLDCIFRRGDAFDFVSGRRVDGAFNWFTSFGYDMDDARNLKMLVQAFKSLKRGGWFALDYHNPLSIVRRSVSVRRYTKRVDGKTVRVVRKSRIDPEHGTLTSEWRYSVPGRPVRTRAGTTRLYMPVDLRRMFREAGFRDLRFFGGADGRPLSSGSPRCIVVARKPL